MNDTNSKIQVWLGVANLLLTFIIGIVIALFLDERDKQFQYEMKTRDEQFQISLAELKTQLDSQINLTTLSVSASSSTQFNCAENISRPCGSFVIIKNTGNVPAKNVKIIIILANVDTEWLDVIKDVNAFSYTIFPPINSEAKPIKIDRVNDYNFYSNKVPGDNAIEITVDNLSVNSSVEISFQLSPAIQVTKYGANQSTMLYRPDTQPEFGFSYRDLLIQLNSFASFQVFGYCDNCKITQENPSLSGFTVSNFSDWNINNIKSVENTKYPGGTPWYAWSVDIQLECMAPINTTSDVCTLYEEIYCDDTTVCDFKLGQ